MNGLKTMTMVSKQCSQNNDNESQNNGQYGKGDKNDSTIKFGTKLLSKIFVIIQMHIFL